MELLIALAASSVFVALFKGAIKKVPVVFYIIAVVVNALFLSHAFFEVLPVFTRVLYPYLQRGLFSFGLFTLVMFIGVFPDDSKVKRYFKPIRAEVSIIAAILTISHIVNYGTSYATRALMGFSGMAPSTIASFAIALALIILLAVLTVTSFNFIKTRMDTTRWKSLQKLAYIFFGLIYIHLTFLLVPSMLGSGTRAAISVIGYSLVMLVYLFLKVRKYLHLRQRRFSEAD